MPTLINGDDDSSNNHPSGKERTTILSCTNSGVQLWSMSRRGAAFFRGSSGSYNVRASELARQKRQQQQQQQQQQRHILLRGLLQRDPPQLKLIPCIVFFLDDTQHNFDMDKGVKGQVLLDAVFQHLELIEKDYFGLQYADVAPAPDALRWLDPTKSLRKQMRVGPPYLLYFRVKFYISDPSKLQEEYTRYHFFLQVKKDMIEGRLVVPAPTAALLASYSVQSELGDYNPEEHRPGYLTELRLVPEPSPEIERRITELHKLHRGQTPADAEYNFLDHVKRLDSYGVDAHRARVRDSTGAEIQLGVTSTGLVVFQNNVKINTFSWAKIVKISFKRKQFFIQLRRQGAESYDNLLGFNMLSYRSCKNLWKSCVEHHAFFRLHTPRPPPPKKLLFFLSLGSRFRYSGRTEYQTVEEGKRKARPDRTFMRSPSRRYTQPRVASLLEPIGPALTIREPPKPKITLQVPPSSSRPAQITQQLVGKGETPSTSHPRSLQIGHPSQQQQVVRPYDTVAFGHVTSRISETDTYVKPRKAWESPDNGNAIDESQRQSLQSLQPPPQIMLGQVYGHPRTPVSTSSIGTSSSLMGHAQPSTSHDRGSLGLSFMMKGLEYMDDDPSEELYDVPSSQHLGPGSSSETSGSTNGVCPYRPVTVRMVADENGRFGFNVKGGADQGMSSILVSRVAPGTPASLCTSPGRLREGDQVISIDGQDVAGLTHEQVVNLIRNAGESTSRELHLQIYPNILYGDRTQGDLYGSRTNGENASKMEPDFMYIPAYNHQQMRFGTSGSTSYCDELVASMLMLSEQCETGSLEFQYARVERRMSNLTCEVAEKPENRACNRYSDVLPYDSTRVTLQNGSPNGGDYINANYINMEIPSSGLTNRFIATQGPLFRTTSSFWQMVWEQSAPLILMLTQTKEGNHAKCFQYWPEPLTFAVYGKFKVTNAREYLDRETSTFMIRQFMLTNTETGESREITQLQYLNWPDYGVPADPTDFIKFVLKVRKMMGESASKPLSPSREGSGVYNRDVAVVHCSAGVGRTGVFILVDTAMCLIEANEPVYPQETLRHMRRWRALLVQNYQQYHFACQIILRCFNEELVVPLPEYSRRT